MTELRRTLDECDANADAAAVKEHVVADGVAVALIILSAERHAGEHVRDGHDEDVAEVRVDPLAHRVVCVAEDVKGHDLVVVEADG